MRNFILGTDWWTDCDDAVAIANSVDGETLILPPNCSRVKPAAIRASLMTCPNKSYSSCTDSSP